MWILQHILYDHCRLKKSMLASLMGMTLWQMHVTAVLADESDKIETSDTIVLGRVSNNPRKHYAALDALGRYLAKNSDEIEGNETLLARDNEEMIEFLRTGEVDLVSETPFSAILYEQAADAKIVLRQWKDGRPSYRTLFFTRKDSNIEQLEDLAGQLIAFEDRGSTSGYFVPRATLADHGLISKFVGQLRSDTDVGYLFADSEVNVTAWVARRKVDAGVTSDVHWDDDSRTPSGLKKELRVFHRTPEIVRSVMVVRPGLDEKRLEDIVDILLGMHESDAGRDVLEDFYETKQFDRLAGDAKASLDHVRTLFDLLDNTPPF